MEFNPKQINTTALAYIGDAVYEIYVRERVLLESGVSIKKTEKNRSSGVENSQKVSGIQRQPFGAHVDALHKRAIRYVRADGQAKAIRTMIEEGFLSDEEAALVRRAKNHKTASKPKNADAMDYKYATAFEALIGYHRLAGGEKRIDEIVQYAFRIIDR